MSTPHVAARRGVRYRVQHLTTYRYTQPVSLARHLLHLTPREFAEQTVESHQLHVMPTPTLRRDWQDSFGNPVVSLAIESAHDTLRVSAESVVTVAPRVVSAGGGPRPAAGDASLTVGAVRQWLAYLGGARGEGGARDSGPPGAPGTAPVAVSAFLFPSPHALHCADLDPWIASFLDDAHPLEAALAALTAAIHREFRYDPRATAVGTPVSEVLQRRAGVCQDFAHLLLACLRRAGLAARYVSGYLLTAPPPGQPRLRGADASHAWVAVALPGRDGRRVRWLEFDPTNGGRADQRYVVLGWGRDFGDVSPLRGVILGGGEHRLEVQVTVSPEDEAAAQAAFPAEAGFA